jgi:hypothetical protein
MKAGVLLAPRRGRAFRARAVTAVMAAALLAAGCAHGPTGPQPPSVESCTTFGINAIKHHITVTALPAACRGLTKAQVNFAVGRAIYASTGTVHGKARRRALALKLSPLLAQLVSKVPPQRVLPPGPAPAASKGSGPSLGLLALISWLVTVGLGGWMLVRWIARGGLRRAAPGILPPQLTVAHFGLAVAGLLAWIVYLTTGLTAIAWAASVILLPVAGLGMALVLWLPERAPVPAAAPAAQAVPAGAAVPDGAAVPAAPARPGPPPAQHPPAVIVAAHGVFAVATILFTLLAAVGPH